MKEIARRNPWNNEKEVNQRETKAQFCAAGWKSC